MLAVIVNEAASVFADFAAQADTHIRDCKR
jgi:hypothetical protein